MASRVVMPKLTDTMEEGLIIQWYKSEGDLVESGEVLAEIETDKAVMDLEAYASGVLRKVLVPAESRVPAGDLIAVIAREDEDISHLLEHPSSSATMTRGSSEKKEIRDPQKEEHPEERPVLKNSPITPRARKLALEGGLVPENLIGSGPAGLITERDVREALQAVERHHEDFTEIELSPMRRAIAQRMTQSKQTVPHFYVSTSLGMDQILSLKAQLLKNQVKASITDFLIRGIALSLKNFPQINVGYSNGKIRRFHGIHIGLAVGLDDGIITPVVRNADQKLIPQIVSETRELVARARARKLSPEEFSGSTFSLSNLGMFEVDHFMAIVQPGEGAVLAVGSIVDTPHLENGLLKVEKHLKATLSCDHRVIDGLHAAQFLQDLKHRMEAGEIQ